MISNILVVQGGEAKLSPYKIGTQVLIVSFPEANR